MPEISKGCLASNTSFDQSTDESKVSAGRDTLVFWWKQVVFTKSSQPNLSYPLMRDVFFPSCFKQLPKLHSPIWHLRKVSFSLASCRLLYESFCYREVSHSCCECLAGSLLSFAPPSSTGFISCLLAAGVKQAAPVLSPCSLSNCPL